MPIRVKYKRIEEFTFNISYNTMSPLVTILVIMLLTVVYNESQFVADYQDDYQNVLTKNAVPFDLCDVASKRKMCKKSSNLWRQFLRKTDYHLRDDTEDFSREFAHDYTDDDDIETPSVKADQKRNSPHTINSNDGFNCAIVTNHVDLGKGYYPRVIGNVTCDFTANESLKVCSRGSSCQPVEYSARVLSRGTHCDTVPFDAPQDSKGCWLFEEIPIHIGCKCARSF